MATSTKTQAKVSLVLAEELVKYIRLLAKTGRGKFRKYLYDPLDYAGWKLEHSNEKISKLMERISRGAEDTNSLHTVPPLCKRLVSVAMSENLSALGDSAIFFLIQMQIHTSVSTSVEARQFTQIIQWPLKEFYELHESSSFELFEEALGNLTRDEIKRALAPVDLGRHQIKVKMQNEALELFGRIRLASKKEDFVRCRKLIAAYMIRFAEQADNNEQEVNQLITALTRKRESFRVELNDAIAIELYYKIIAGITENDLARTIRAIRRYALIFRGDDQIRYYYEIDKLEKPLYQLIREKDLWEELKRTSRSAR